MDGDEYSCGGWNSMVTSWSFDKMIQGVWCDEWLYL